VLVASTHTGLLPALHTGLLPALAASRPAALAALAHPAVAHHAHAPMTLFQGAVLGLLQGVAEPFPISSLGHGVVLPRVLGWNIHQNDKFFLSFLVATHLATALVLLGFFWRDWVRIARGLLRSLREREIRPEDTDARLGWLLVVGTIPAGAIGLLLEQSLRKLFASPASAAAFLIVNGVALLAFERLRRRAPEPGDHLGDADRRLAGLSWRQAIGIGTSQVAALVPGISRSGFTMGGGLLAGLSNEDALRFSFLLATPIIGAAAVLKVPDLLGPDGDGVRGAALLGAAGAAVTTVFAVRFLLRFFQTNRLTPFGVYCIAVGTALTVGFALT
jgi:undecaprenyl-diphosphatase